jgi:regulator of protease activity HflC (stomatin/prohibitin superfamily)
MKLGLERAVLSQQREQGEEGSEGAKSKKQALAHEIDNLLKRGAYDVFRDDDDEEANRFMETDIDQLMQSSAKTVTYGKRQTSLSSGLGSFSKASFVTDTGDGEKDVDLDDPDFWSKAVGLDKPVEIPEEISQMIDDGVKRSRKQVQQFNPYAEYTEKEEKRIQAEKEELDRINAEKMRKKMLAMEKKRKALEEKEGGKKQSKSLTEGSKRKKSNDEQDGNLPSKRMKTDDSSVLEKNQPKKGTERKRALQKLEKEDPAIEKLKQAWEVPHRNRLIAACIRFGFSRFTKIRNESGFQSLPIQDIEVFCRSCKSSIFTKLSPPLSPLIDCWFFSPFSTVLFQQSLQLSLACMQKLKTKEDSKEDDTIQTFLLDCLGPFCSREFTWLRDCLAKGIGAYMEVEDQTRSLRLPVVLTECSYVSDLRRGHALRSLRRIHLLLQVEKVIECCVDEIINGEFNHSR